MYGKIHQSLYTGSLLGAGPDVFAVWGWVIAHVVDGVVEINPTLLAMVIGKISPEEVCEVLRFLGGPDKNSRTRAEDGRRLIPISEDSEIMPGRAVAYRVVNHALYRDFKTPASRREYMRDYMAQRRKKDQSVNSVKPVNSLAVNVRHTDTDTDTEEKTEKNSAALAGSKADFPSGLESFWQSLPPLSRNRSSRKKCRDEWTRLKLEPMADKVLDALQLWCRCFEWTKEGGQFVPGGHKWLKDEKWRDIPSSAKPAYAEGHRSGRNGHHPDDEMPPAKLGKDWTPEERAEVELAMRTPTEFER